jgi:hypothetical protein
MKPDGIERIIGCINCKITYPGDFSGGFEVEYGASLAFMEVNDHL